MTGVLLKEEKFGHRDRDTYREKAVGRPELHIITSQETTKSWERGLEQTLP